MTERISSAWAESRSATPLSAYQRNVACIGTLLGRGRRTAAARWDTLEAARPYTGGRRRTTTAASAPLGIRGKPAAVPRREGVGEAGVGLPHIARLAFDGDAVARGSLVHRVAAPAVGSLIPLRADRQERAGTGAGADDHVVGPRRAVDEVPLAQRTLLPLDDQHAFTGEDEEVLLVGLPVVHPDRLARAEDVEEDAHLSEARPPVERKREATLRALAPAGLGRVEHEPAVAGRHPPLVGLLDR